MPSFNEPLKNWFGYTRRERRSTFILLFITVAVIGVRFILPEQDIEIREIVYDYSDSPSEKLQENSDKNSKPERIAGMKGDQKPMPVIDLNTCDSAALEKLPGIGPVLSVRIIKFRNLLGGYSSVSQLKEVYGLSEETFNLISSRVCADSSSVRKIRINSAGYREIIRFPYFDRYEVSSILKYRELNGKIGSVEEMIGNKLIAAEKADKVRPYIEFSE